MGDLWREISRLYNKFFLRQPLVQRIVLGLGAYCLVFAVLLLVVIPPQINITVGQTSSRTIHAPHNIIDLIATEKAKEQAEQSVPDAYVRHRQLEQQVIDTLHLISEIIINNKSEDIATIRQSMINELPSKIAAKTERLSDNTLKFIIELPLVDLVELNMIAEDLILDVYEEGVGSTDSGLALIQHKTSDLNIGISKKLYLDSLLATVYQPSYTFNEELTNQLKEEARKNVAPILVNKGAIIVVEGQVINDHIYSLLETAGLLSTVRRTQMIFGVALYLLVIFLITIGFLKAFCRNIYDKIASLVLFTLLVVISIIATTLLVRISPYLVMSVTVGILVTVLLDWPGALIAVMAHNAVIAPLIMDNIHILVMATVSGIVAVVSSYRMNQRSDMLKTALFVASVNGTITVALQFVSGVEMVVIAENALIGIAGGIAFVIMSIGSLPFFENTFGIISTVRLLELSNPNRPLLRKLLVEAPGTYNHSIVMGNLAEAAAEAIGADPLLARVGAYYHDIGKIKRPGFFVENQLTEENPHDKYAPSLSAIIITSHIKDGIEMAKEARLPQPVIDIIAQHHGTTLVSYFYHRALEQSTEDKQVRKVDYRYDGPRPQTKEAGIIMLSDAIEAAVRSLKRRSTKKVEEVVRKIIKSRLSDGELDECDLTMRDLDKLADTYIRALSGVYHNRIAYPERSIADLERSRKLGRYSN